MSILLDILDKDKWEEFFEYKKSKIGFDNNEETFIKNFINNGKYLIFGERFKKQNYDFSIPTKKIINKIATNKKRIVYTFLDEEMLVLKFLAFQLKRYNNIFSDLCFSFRSDKVAKDAIDFLLSHRDLKNCYCYKVDVKNYFNSIDKDILLGQLKNIFSDDKEFFEFCSRLLKKEKAIFNNEVIQEKMGAMAGNPLASFFANVYLMDLDNYFFENNIIYARYSDDIIFFVKTEEELKYYQKKIFDFLSNKKLEINKDKEFVFLPNENWNFLGIKYVDGQIDIADNTIQKMKGKIRRKARAILRWKKRKILGPNQAIKAMTKIFNFIFFNEKSNRELSWSRWFFPIITSTNGLNIIDKYLQQNLRYVAFENHSKKSYNIRYDYIKKLNYKTLVNEYYKFRVYKKHNEKN